jgi:hypothetical protein
MQVEGLGFAPQQHGEEGKEAGMTQDGWSQRWQGHSSGPLLLQMFEIFYNNKLFKCQSLVFY